MNVNSAVSDSSVTDKRRLRLEGAEGGKEDVVYGQCRFFFSSVQSICSWLNHSLVWWWTHYSKLPGGEGGGCHTHISRGFSPSTENVGTIQQPSLYLKIIVRAPQTRITITKQKKVKQMQINAWVQGCIERLYIDRVYPELGDFGVGILKHTGICI